MTRRPGGAARALRLLALTVLAATPAAVDAQELPTDGSALTPDQRLGVYEAATRRLLDMGVLSAVPRGDVYCLHLTTPDPEAESSIRTLLGGGPPRSTEVFSIPPDLDACLADVRFRRYVLEEPRRADDGRIEVQASGDHLGEWPPGFDGVYWGRWVAGCAIADGAPESVECGVSPIRSGDPAVDERYQARRGRFFGTGEDADARGRPVRLVARGATGVRADTLEFHVDSVAWLYDLPVLSPGADRCTASSTLTAGSDWPPDEHRLVRIELSSGVEFAPWAVHLLDVVRDRPSDASETDVVSACGEPRSQPFAITALEGVGPPLAGPVRHCPDQPCREEVTVGVHDPLPVAFRFRLSDFDIDGTDGTVHLQLETDGWGTGLVPFLVVSGERPRAEAFRPTWHARHHRIPLARSPRFEADPEVLLYLILR